MRARERGDTPGGFRAQLLQRLRNEALRSGIPAQRFQQQVAWERLLVRLPRDGTWVLKGGFALQLRYGASTRSTRDIDLRTTFLPEQAVDELRLALSTAVSSDHFSFEVGEVAEELQGAPGGSLRVRMAVFVAGVALTTFHLDLSCGDALVEQPEMLRGSNILDFAGIAPIEFPAYPVAQRLAEKLHAYTLLRARENTRVKDLVDLATLAATENVDAIRLAAAVEATFEVRSTHPIPDRLPEPPYSWTQPFSTIASEIASLSSTTLKEGYALAAGFWDPFLVTRAEAGEWNAGVNRWQPRPADV